MLSFIFQKKQNSILILPANMLNAIAHVHVYGSLMNCVNIS